MLKATKWWPGGYMELYVLFGLELFFKIGLLPNTCGIVTRKNLDAWLWKEMESLAMLCSLFLKSSIYWIWVEAAPLPWVVMGDGTSCSRILPPLLVFAWTLTVLCFMWPFFNALSVQFKNPTFYETFLVQLNLVSHLHLLALEQWLSEGSCFAPLHPRVPLARAHLEVSGGIFGCHMGSGYMLGGI